MNLIKDDLQFILENKSKSKLKERLETSLNNSAFNESNCLNSSIASSLSKGRIKTKYNLTEKIDNKNLTKFQEFLSTYNQNKNVLLLVDSKNNIWEFVRRPDLSIASLSTNENITSILSNIGVKKQNNYNSNLNNSNIIDEKLLNIEIKENEEKSFINSELDISKVTDFNLSALIRDTQNNENISEIN
jgi:hypothetical protein